MNKDGHNTACDHGRKLGTPCPHCLGLNNQPTCCKNCGNDLFLCTCKKERGSELGQILADFEVKAVRNITELIDKAYEAGKEAGRQSGIAETYKEGLVPYPEHTCRFNDPPQSCDCYGAGKMKGIEEGLTDKKDWSTEEYRKSYDRGYKIGSSESLSTYKSELRKKLEGMKKEVKYEGGTDISKVLTNGAEHFGHNAALDAAINLIDN